MDKYPQKMDKFKNEWKIQKIVENSKKFRFLIFADVEHILFSKILDFQADGQNSKNGTNPKNDKNFKNGQISPKNGQNSKMNEKSKKCWKIQKKLDK